MLYFRSVSFYSCERARRERGISAAFLPIRWVLFLSFCTGYGKVFSGGVFGFSFSSKVERGVNFSVSRSFRDGRCRGGLLGGSKIDGERSHDAAD